MKVLDSVKNIFVPLLIMYNLSGCIGDDNKYEKIEHNNVSMGTIDVDTQSSEYACGFNMTGNYPSVAFRYVYEKNIPFQGQYSNILTLWLRNMGEKTKGVTFIDKGMNGIWNTKVTGSISFDPEIHMGSIDILAKNNWPYWKNVEVTNLDTLNDYAQSNVKYVLNNYLKLIE
ncbi:hypothetical protein K9L67_00695 [Candidatus Woesearchaeota archaeon]|nr:hypothetical protein [Candidatus Woesearchaeota archaeon]MCF7900725.1 hypothetical protein [Candidatus Woesearchaeota archaeon]MCF8013246.1 hypothetical protein [Candidatus Woesearchaeota archaeon]